MSKNTLFPFKSSLRFQGKLRFVDRPIVMGILNATPDSFFPGSRVALSAKSAGHSPFLDVVEQARQMMAEGADILDIGGCSTRPGAAAVSEQEELDRVLPVIRSVKRAFPDQLVSVDTWRASVAEQAISEGADLINDVSGGRLDPHMFETVIRLKVPYVLMHSRGTPESMASLAQYGDVSTEVVLELADRVKVLLDAGCSDLIIDPGFGFAKTPEQGFQLLNQLDVLVNMGFPVLVGVSRKSMITRTLSVAVESHDALWGTLVLNTIALERGAHILRVHDVAPAVQAVRLWEKVRGAELNAASVRSSSSKHPQL